MTVRWSAIMLDEHSARRFSGRCYLVVVSSCSAGVGLTLRDFDGCTFGGHFGNLGGRARTWGLFTCPLACIAVVPWELRVSFFNDEMFILKSIHSSCLRISEWRRPLLDLRCFR